MISRWKFRFTASYQRFYSRWLLMMVILIPHRLIVVSRVWPVGVNLASNSRLKLNWQVSKAFQLAKTYSNLLLYDGPSSWQILDCIFHTTVSCSIACISNYAMVNLSTTLTNKIGSQITKLSWIYIKCSKNSCLEIDSCHCMVQSPRKWWQPV